MPEQNPIPEPRPADGQPASAADPNWPRDIDARLRRLGKAGMEVTVVLGRTQMPLEEVLSVEPGAVIETGKLSGQPMDLLVNGAPFGRGEVIVIGDHIAIRINELFPPGQA